MPDMRFLAAGDSAMVVEFGKTIEDELNRKVHAMSCWIEAKEIPGVTEVIPTFRSLMVCYDYHVIKFARLKEILEQFDTALSDTEKSIKKIRKVPCCYGARFGVDLADMEKITGIDRDEIIRIHSSVDYKIYMLGFLPGFVYLGGLDKRLEVPRLKTPRIKIQPGAVGIGGSQTGVYPIASPGGWRLIGGTPLDFYNPDREHPILCEAGEYIRFVPVNIDEYYDIRNMVLKGTYRMDIMGVSGESIPDGRKENGGGEGWE